MSSDTQGIFTHLFVNVPKNWEVRILPDVVDFQEGPGILAKDFHDSGVPLLRLSSISGPVTTFEGCNFLDPEKVKKKWDHFRLKEKDILLSTSGSLGRVSEVAAQQEGSICYTGIIRFRPQSDRILYSFIKYFLQSEQFKLQAESSASGSVLSHFGPTHLKKMSFPVPPIDYQKFIEGLISPIDDKIQLNHQINQTLEQMAQAIFKSWFVDFEPVKAKIAALEAGGSEEDALLAAMQAISGEGEAEITRLQSEQPEQYAELRATAELFPSAMQDSELGEIPEGWTIAPFSSIARLDTTSVKPAQDRERVWEHYSIPAFDEGATPAFETGADIKSNKYKVYPTAVLSSKLNPHFPRTWIPDVQNPDAAICSTEFMQFVPLEPQHRAFIAGMITSEPFQSGIMMRVTGSTGSRQRAQPKQVAAMDVILPKSELRAVYSQHTEAMYRMQSKNIWQAQSLASVRDTLLPMLLSGELSVIDSENQLTEEELMPQEEIN